MGGRRWGARIVPESPMVRELPPQRRQRQADTAAIFAGVTLAEGVAMKATLPRTRPGGAPPYGWYLREAPR